MRIQTLNTAVLAALLALAGQAHAAQSLLPPTAGDQVSSRLAILPAPAAAIERKPVTFAWTLDPAQNLLPPAPLQASSREYWQTVDAAELAKGVSLPTTAEGALIRISPAAGAAGLQDAAISVSNGQRGIAIARQADAQALLKAGMPVSPGTQVLRLGAGSGAGHAVLRASNARGKYVVHVFEPNSDVLLQAQPARNAMLAGQAMRVPVSASRAGAATAAQAQALLVAPDGSSTPVRVRTGRQGELEAVFTPPLGTNHGQGLWELQVFAMVGDAPRDVRTAFAVAQPTAGFTGRVDAQADLQVDVAVRAASPGRYEARGTLYATGPDGKLHPVIQAHSATWMEAGQHALSLPFSKANLPAGYGAPFEVRQLELHDQSRMAPLEIRARGIRF
ncbi:MAG: DUF4785 family protein [Xanthomonadaceae bacterium]|nr:DUF4785 family protein [Xanthomonadaceae bacterium]